MKNSLFIKNIILIFSYIFLISIPLIYIYLFEIKKYDNSDESKNIIANIGANKIKISKDCAENVEYDNDPSFGEKLKIIHIIKSSNRIRGFGIDVHYPSMKCKENKQLINDYYNNQLNKKNPWIHIGIIAGEYYPKFGLYSTNNLAKFVTKTIDHPTEFWFSNYEKISIKIPRIGYIRCYRN